MVPDEILNGGSGNDTLIGGVGNDTYVLDGIGDSFTENAGEGIDTVMAPYSFNVAGTNIENVTLLGAANLIATGDAGNNVLVGNAGDNVFFGGAGNDTINGGNNTLMSFTRPVTPTADGAAAILASLVRGGDTVDYSGVTGNLVANIGPAVAGGPNARTATGEGTDSLTNIENITAGTGNDTIYDSDAANILLGGAGNDTISTLGGDDFVDAGAGTDVIQHSGLLSGNTLLYGGDDHDYDRIYAGDGDGPDRPRRWRRPGFRRHRRRYHLRRQRRCRG